MSEAVHRLAEVRGRVSDACRRAGRDPGEVTLVGASKLQPVELLVETCQAGLLDFGENRVQEAQAKKPLLPATTRWHLLGPLQSNKAQRAADLFDVIHSIDRPRIISVLEHHTAQRERRLQCFGQVLLGGEETKHGFSPEDLHRQLVPFLDAPHLELVGLMTIPPPAGTPDDARPWFRALRELSRELQERWPLPYRGWLSMGMSDDFEVAIEEGATHVRVGTALFGPRTPDHS
jgi:pyridoxal phosphate enzyme (YggS family)